MREQGAGISSDKVRAMSQPHVLVVEGEASLRADIVDAVRRDGFIVSDASSGSQALNLVAQRRPDIALIAGRLSGTSGLELGKRLTAEHNIPFVVLSADADAKFVNEAIHAGALGLLVKPIEVSKVLPTLRAALVRGKELQSLNAGHGRLQNAIDRHRTASVAVGILMRSHGLNREEAFEALRQQARRQRRKFDEIAEDLVLAVETLNNAAPRVDHKEHAEAR